jgi:hypothetical protein
MYIYRKLSGLRYVDAGSWIRKVIAFVDMHGGVSGMRERKRESIHTHTHTNTYTHMYAYISVYIYA